MKQKGFTLIELLIVVAIIAILAAIAVPNFLEAQTRAKVTRMKADMRSIATALETYAIDNNKYPFDKDSRGWPWYLTDVMTTPIAYLTTARMMLDQFRMDQAQFDAKRLRYVNMKANRNPAWRPCPYPGPFLNDWVGGKSDAVIDRAMDLFGEWKLSSAGPDKVVNQQDAANGIFVDDLYYDPSNGTVSGGDIVLSGKGMKGS